MTNINNKIHYGQIMESIRKKMKEEDPSWDISDRYVDKPELPIDLFCKKRVGYDKETKKPIMNYHVFLVSSVEQITERFRVLLSFCRFYLTFYQTPSPRDLKLTLVIAAGAEIQNEKFYKENRFGLWIVNREEDSTGLATFKITEKLKPLPFRDKQKVDFKNKFMIKGRYLSPGESKKAPKNHTDALKAISSDDKASEYVTRSFDEYIRDAGEAIMKFRPISFEGRYIDKKLLELNIELKNILYKDELFSFLNEHLSKKESDFEFCSSKLNELWCSYLDDRGYPLVHEKFEPLLKQLLPKYRDHFLHQYQDFLLGTYILDGLIQNDILDKEKTEDYSRGWLLASTFHDFSYCIQEYDKWSTEFFKEMFNIKEPIGSIDLKRHYFENSFSSSIEHLLSELERSLSISENSRIDQLNTLRHFFYHQMTDNKNHAVISCLTLFKRFEKYKEEEPEEFKNMILHAGLSVLLHDDEIWQTLSGYKSFGGNQEEKWISDVREAKLLQKLDFEVCPLAFLLIVCDNVQDWGRPFNDVQIDEILKIADVHLRNVVVTSEEVTIQIYTRVLGKTKKFLGRKRNVMNKLQKILKAPLPFIVEYWDSIENKPTEYRFQIGSD